MDRPTPEMIAYPKESTIALTRFEFEYIDESLAYAVRNWGTAVSGVPDIYDKAEWVSGGHRYIYRVEFLGVGGQNIRIDYPDFFWRVEQKKTTANPEGVDLVFYVDSHNLRLFVIDDTLRPANHFEVNEFMNMALDLQQENHTQQANGEAKLIRVGMYWTLNPYYGEGNGE